ncbi:MAG: hypothetical protein ACQEWI_07440 [Bacillota bacterium]
MEYLLIFGGILVAYTAMRIWFGAKRAKVYAENLKNQKYNVMDPALQKIDKPLKDKHRGPIG